MKNQTQILEFARMRYSMWETSQRCQNVNNLNQMFVKKRQDVFIIGLRSQMMSQEYAHITSCSGEIKKRLSYAKLYHQ